MKSILKVLITMVLIIPNIQAQINKNTKITTIKPNTAALLVTKKMTNFQPTTHGFKFANTFKAQVDIAGLNGPTLSGHCAGMTYAALDYFKANKPIPTQDFKPAKGTDLQKFIYERQIKANMDDADKWGELVLNPFGWRTEEFFNWGLQGSNGGRIQELRASIDAGNPVPIGLFKAGNGGVGPHHEVLAIGYDMGRYKGDLGSFKEDVKIYVYDSNFPNSTMTLVAKPGSLSFAYVEDPGCNWLTYFVSKKYVAKNPPTINTVKLPNDGLVRELLITVGTGADDLRGGNDNVHAIVNFTNGTSETHENINKRQKWIGNYDETVVISLRTARKLNEIKSVSFKTTFNGTYVFGSCTDCDNWNVDFLDIFAKDGQSQRCVYTNAGNPLVRFNANNIPFEAVFYR